MKSLSKAVSIFVCVLFTLTALFALSSCKKQKEEPQDTESVASVIKQEVSLWDNVLYSENATIGTGSKKIAVQVTAKDKYIVLIIFTDAGTLADALNENSLIEGENGEYGIYIKKVNGILADYSKDKAYWSLFKSGELLMTGADRTPISNGDEFEIRYVQE